MADKRTLEKAIIALVGEEALEELDELNAHPDLKTWRDYWFKKLGLRRLG